MSKRVSIVLPGEMRPPPVPPKPKTRSKLMVKSSLRKPSSSFLETPNTLLETPRTSRTTSSDLQTNTGTRSIPRTTSSDLPTSISTRSGMQMTSSGWSSSSRNYFREVASNTTQRWTPAGRRSFEEQEVSQSDVSQKMSVKASIKSFLEKTVGVVGAGSTTSIIKFLSYFRGDSRSPSTQSEKSHGEGSAQFSPNPTESLVLFRRQKATSEADSLDTDGASSLGPSSQPSVISMKKPSRMEVLAKSSRRSLASVGSRSSSKSRQLLPEFAFALVSADGSIKTPSKGTLDPSSASKGTLDPSSASKGTSEPPSSGATYDERCSCCHCVHMRHAVKQAEFLASDEGKCRQQLKLAAKNFFLDICAMSAVRERILNDLHGTGPQRPSPRISYPLAITSARRMDKRSLALEWFVHDYTDIAHYEIYVDNVLCRSIYNPRTLSTVLLDINVSKPHKLRMRPIPVQGRAPGAKPEDKMVQQLREVGLASATTDTLCQCLKQQEQQQQQQERRKCKSMLDFWTDSEYLYLPAACTRS
ncbi:uncharacterized protein LOC111079800 [Drosophila obscura]|uniref:uncharacterized protein LOC111079800 n=1 Tax=Drosophila obscura TaxID=7282 RepID=UPI001BB1936E|nr:uncharacterized protein LOC111079800 [Drosophila obscura]